MNLTPNFTLYEFFKSDTARARSISNVPATVADLVRVIDNIAHLADILQSVRDQYGGAIRITSGYRCPALNRAVGGVADSYHLKGAAADLQAADMPRLLRCLRQHDKEIKTIVENGWYHVQLKPPSNSQGLSPRPPQ